MITAYEALERLREGNRRFASGATRPRGTELEGRRAELLDGQNPFAVVLACSDSRVPVEMVFDQGLGRLFVVRVAGNLVGPTLTGSIEFAASKIGTPLVVVLGHSDCGAVKATVGEMRKPTAGISPNLKAIVDFVRPSVERVLAVDPGCDEQSLVQQAVRANVRAVVARLRRDSALLKTLIEKEGLLVVGAEYSLETGEVTFMDGGR